MNLFLRAKHWQLFLLLFGLPFVFQVIMMVNIFSNLMVNHNPTMIVGYFKFFPLLMALCLGTLFGWLWSVGIGLQKNIPDSVDMKTTRFKIFFFIPIIYLILLMGGLTYIFSGGILSGGQLNPEIFYLFPVIFPLHLFSMFCIFYCIYFVAKTIKTAELQREVIFSDFMAEFFLVWFNLIGIWILQPKINKMADGNKSDLIQITDN